MGDDDEGDRRESQSFTARARDREPAVKPRIVESLDVDDPHTLADPDHETREASPPTPARPDPSALEIDLPEPTARQDDWSPPPDAAHHREDVSDEPRTGPVRESHEPLVSASDESEEEPTRRSRPLESGPAPPPAPPVPQIPEDLDAFAYRPSPAEEPDEEPTRRPLASGPAPPPGPPAAREPEELAGFAYRPSRTDQPVGFEVLEARIVDPQPRQPPARRAPPPTPTLEFATQEPAPEPEPEPGEAEQESLLARARSKLSNPLATSEGPGVFSRFFSSLRDRLTPEPEPADVVFETAITRPPAPPMEDVRKPWRSISPVPLAADPRSLAGQPEEVLRAPEVPAREGEPIPARPETKLEADPRKLSGAQHALAGQPPSPRAGRRVPARPARTIDPEAVARPGPVDSAPPTGPSGGNPVPARPSGLPRRGREIDTGFEGVPGRPGDLHAGPAPEPSAGPGEPVPARPSPRRKEQDWRERFDPEELDRSVDAVLDRYERGSK